MRPTSRALVLALAALAAAATATAAAAEAAPLFAGGAAAPPGATTSPPDQPGDPSPLPTRRAHVRGAAASPPADPLGGLLDQATGRGGGDLASLLAAGGRAEAAGAEEGEGGGEGARAPLVNPAGGAAQAALPPALVGDLPPAPTVSAGEEAAASAPTPTPTPTPTETETATPEAPAVAEEENVDAPAADPAAADPAATPVADPTDIASRLSAIGVIAPDLLDRFTAVLASGGGGAQGGGAGDATPPTSSLLGGSSLFGGGSATNLTSTSLLGSLLGGGVGGPDASAADAPATGNGTEPTARPTDGASSSSSSDSPPPPATGGEAALALHNAARARHVDTPPLTWSPTIAAAAAKVAARCVFAHSATPLGENIAMGQRSWGEVVRAWYNEEGPRGGHRTQVVWAASAELGCGAAACGRGLGGGGTLYVCQYSPAGNVVGEYGANVKPLKG